MVATTHPAESHHDALKGTIIVRITSNHTPLLLLAGAAALAIAAAPSASAAPNEPPCTDMGGSTQCQSTGNVQIYTTPHAMPGTANSTYGPFVGYNHGRN
jgi:hypothetical protein